MFQRLFGPLWQTAILKLKLSGYFWRSLGYFLFQHLVALCQQQNSGRNFETAKERQLSQGYVKNFVRNGMWKRKIRFGEIWTFFDIETTLKMGLPSIHKNDIVNSDDNVENSAPVSNKTFEIGEIINVRPTF